MTNVDLAALVLRVVVGAIFVTQGSRKLFAADDAPHGRGGLRRTIEASRIPRAGALAIAVSVLELTCGAFVLLGLATRLALLPLAGILTVAIVRFKWNAGFIGGWDWPLSVLAASVAIALLGPGPLSLDAVVFHSP